VTHIRKEKDKDSLNLTYNFVEVSVATDCLSLSIYVFHSQWDVHTTVQYCDTPITMMNVVVAKVNLGSLLYDTRMEACSLVP
jgi:uncharacterized protein with PQ loop repeat